MNLAFAIAWRQLRHQPAKLTAGVAGVLFACLLMLMQLGFEGALFDSATSVQRGMKGDLFIIHTKSDALWQGRQFPRAWLERTLAVPGVDGVSPLYAGIGKWKNPWTGTERSIMVFGLDPAQRLLDFHGLREQQHLLTQTDVALFDVLSRPEFGDIGGALHTRPRLAVEVSGHGLEVVGAVRIGASFGADGNMVTSGVNFLRIFGNSRTSHGIDVGLVRVKPGTSVRAVQAALKSVLPSEVMCLTQPEFVMHEKRYWQTATPIGTIFTMGVIMGFVVGVVVVYQILFSEVASHLSEYATLIAIGYRRAFLAGVVAAAAIQLAVMGFIPGLLASRLLYRLVGQLTFLRMELPLSRIMLVLSMTLAMCLCSGLLAMRKLQSADPADVF